MTGAERKSTGSCMLVCVKPRTPLPTMVMSRKARKPAETRTANKPRSRKRRSDAKRRSEEHTSELQSLMRITYAVFCFKKKITHISNNIMNTLIHLTQYIKKKKIKKNNKNSKI